MKHHTKVYFDFFGFDVTDWIPCEICQRTSTDVHHVDSRKMGGSKNKDTPGNLMALCRKCHIDYGDIKIYKNYLIEIHFKRFEDLFLSRGYYLFKDEFFVTIKNDSK